MSRKTARESAFKLVFEFLFSKKINQKTYEIFAETEENAGDRNYLHDVYYGVAENYDALLSEISALSNSFEAGRIFKPDLAALLLAIYEMKHMDAIPLSVSISEAVELVKKYSTEKSNQYVNGILASVYQTMTGGEKK